MDVPDREFPVSEDQLRGCILAGFPIAKASYTDARSRKSPFRGHHLVFHLDGVFSFRHCHNLVSPLAVSHVLR